MSMYIKPLSAKDNQNALCQYDPKIRVVDRGVFSLLGQHLMVGVFKTGEIELLVVMESQKHIEYFNQHDPRPRVWVKIPKDVVVKLIADGLCNTGVLSLLKFGKGWDFPECNDYCCDSKI